MHVANRDVVSDRPAARREGLGDGRVHNVATVRMLLQDGRPIDARVAPAHALGVHLPVGDDAALQLLRARAVPVGLRDGPARRDGRGSGQRCPDGDGVRARVMHMLCVGKVGGVGGVVALRLGRRKNDVGTASNRMRTAACSGCLRRRCSRQWGTCHIHKQDCQGCMGLHSIIIINYQMNIIRHAKSMSTDEPCGRSYRQLGLRWQARQEPAREEQVQYVQADAGLLPAGLLPAPHRGSSCFPEQQDVKAVETGNCVGAML